ncbi:MAG: DUF58 domain-containing protein [Bacteroidia bacterium]|nr:DUF58 domain-containing protein [Bacteroidia bacterium]
MTIQEIRQDIRHIQILTKNLLTSQFSGAFRTAIRGTGLEFDEVRQYFAGDDVRRIDWNVSARTNSLFVKQYKEERELNIHLLIDVSRSHRGLSSQKWKQTLSLAATLGQAALNSRDNLSVASFSSILEAYFPAIKNEAQFWANLTQIVSREPKEHTTDIREALQAWYLNRPKRGVVFIFSDCFNPCNYADILKIVSAKYQIVIFRILESSFLPEVRGFLPVQDSETGTLSWVSGNQNDASSWSQINTEILNYLRGLYQKNGIGCVQISSDENYFSKVQLFFSKPFLKQFLL